MTVLGTDLFNRANESPLASPWTEAGTGNTLRLVSNAVGVTTASTDCVYYYSGPTWPADQYSQVKAATLLDAGNFDAGPCVRIVPGGGGDYYIFNLASFIFNIYKVTNLGFGSPLVTAATGGISAGDVLYLEVKTSGGNAVLIAKVNGVQVLTFTDTSSPIATGSAGIGMFDGTARIDDWEGGNFAAPGPTIDVQPQGSAAVVGATTTYSVSATTSGGTLLYQWQYSTNGGETWASASGGSGVDTATYTTPATVSSMNGWMYRCAVTDNNGTVNTLAAYFFVSGLPNTGRGRRPPTSAWFARTENKGGLRTGANPNLLRRNSTRTAGEGYDADIAAAWADWFIAPAPTIPDPARTPFPLIGSRRNRPGRGPYSSGRFYRPDTRHFGSPTVASGDISQAGVAQAASQAISSATVLAAAVAQGPNQAVAGAVWLAKGEAQAAAQAVARATAQAASVAAAAAQAAGGATVATAGAAQGPSQATGGASPSTAGAAQAASQARAGVTAQAKAEAQAAAQATAASTVSAKGEAQSAAQAAGGGTTGTTVTSAGAAQAASQAADGATVLAAGAAAAAAQAARGATVQAQGVAAGPSQAAGPGQAGGGGVVSVAGVSGGFGWAAGGASILVRGVAASYAQAAKTDVVDVDDQYPLAGLSESFPLAGQSETFPLAGQNEQFPLAGLN